MRAHGRTPSRIRSVYLACALVLPLFALPVNAQDGPVEPHPVLATLLGSWQGTGTLLGRAGAFEMEWEVDLPFVRLSYRNAFGEPAGPQTPVLSAEATYLVQGDGATGVWLDTRPQRLTIEVALTDSSFVSTWTAEAESGRTEYQIVGADSVEVRDYVRTGEGERLFAEAAYHRAPPSGRE